ncbi:MAG TPA: hypothetical protein VF974_02505 [Patescibacteria group bacterium]
MTNNILEFKRPDGSSSESEEEAKQRVEAAKKQREAAEFANAKEAEITSHEPGVVFDTGPSDALANMTTEALQIKAEIPKVQEAKVADHTQVFIDRLSNAKSETERIAVMNEVLTASRDGKLPPDQASEILSQTNNF